MQTKQQQNKVKKTGKLTAYLGYEINRFVCVSFRFSQTDSTQYEDLQSFFGQCFRVNYCSKMKGNSRKPICEMNKLVHAI